MVDAEKREVVDAEKREVVDVEKRKVVDAETWEVVDAEKREVVHAEKSEVVDWVTFASSDALRFLKGPSLYVTAPLKKKTVSNLTGLHHELWPLRAFVLGVKQT